MSSTQTVPAGDLYPSRVPVLRHFFSAWRWLRRITDRRRLAIRLLNLPVVNGAGDGPGMLIPQVAGRERSQVQRASEARQRC